MINKNESGIAHPLMLGLIIAVVAVVGFAGWRVANNDEPSLSQETEQSTELAEELPTDLEGVKTIEEVEDILGLSAESKVLEYSLEAENGVTFYVLELTDGRELKVNANTGEVISDDSSSDEYEDDKDDDSSSSNERSESKVAAKLTTSQAYSIAASRHSSPVKEIELEREDDKATYKIEYKDGSKIEIDAVTGSVLKIDIRNESGSSDEEDDEDEEDEYEEDDEDEDEDEEDEDES